MAVASGGILSSMGTVGTTQLTDKVDSPHTGLFKALHNMTQGNVALDFGDTAGADGDITNTTYGFTHTYTWVEGSPYVAVSGGSILYEGKLVSVHNKDAAELDKPPSGVFYHWITVNSAGTIGITMGNTDGVVPDIPAQTVPISLIKVQSTDSSGDLATQFFTTTKQSNSLSIGYDNSNEYTEVGSITGTSAGLFITGIGTAIVVANDKVLIQDTESSDVIKTVRVDSLGALSGAAVLTGTTNNTITTVTAANAITGEANLTFDASANTLAVTGNQTITPANDVGAAALTITNADTDQVALDIAASNIDADVVNIVANAVTTANVLDITSSGLTDGKLFNASTTSTVTDGGTSKILSFTLNNYGVGSQTAKGLSLVYNKLGVTAGGKTANVTGMHIDIDDSVGNTGTVNITGLDIDCNFGNVSGTIKNIGLDVNVAGADTNYSALFSGGNVGIGQTTPIAPLHITYTGNGVGLILESLDSGVTNAPDLMLRRSSASPADDDELGVILFNGEDGAGNSTDYAYISARTTEVDNGSEEGALKFGIMDAGISSTMARLAKPNVGEGLSGITVHAGWHTRATVASVAGATYSPDIACSGIVILMTNGSSIVTLPDVAAADVGVQFTCINTSGGTLTGKIVSADTSNTRFNGAGSYAAQDITDDQALTFLCTGANNWQIIG